MTLNRRHCLRLGVAAALAGFATTRAAWAVSQAGPLAFDTLDLDWADAGRQRAVPVRLYLPQPYGLSVPLPLVVFSHGIGGSRRGYTWLGHHFARHGIASLHLQHVGSDRALWTGSVFGIFDRLQGAAQDGEAVARVQDLRFALDTLLAGDLAGRFDTRRIAAAGHSYGANTTLLASGARVQRGGGLVDLADDRVRAAIVISAPPFYGEDDPSRILASVGVPSLHVTATEDVIRIPGYFSAAEDRIKVYEATGSARKWLAVYEGGSHSMFTDRQGTGGATLNPRVKVATQGLVLAFLRDVFDGDQAALAAWPRQHAGLLARFTAPTAA